MNPVPDSPLPWTGDYLDGFHNKITMIAYANPKDRDNGAKKGEEAVQENPKDGWADGWGLIRFKMASGEVTFECSPRFADVTQPGAKQSSGWPVTVKP